MTSSRLNLLSPSESTEPGFFSRLYDQIENLLDGRSRNSGTVTLADGATTTVVDDPRFQSSQFVVLFPMTAHAAAEVAAGGFYVSDRTTGQFTLTHANNAQTDRTFGYIFAG